MQDVSTGGKPVKGVQVPGVSYCKTVNQQSSQNKKLKKNSFQFLFYTGVPRFNCALLYRGSQILCFIQIKSLWQACIE